jgi:hypothetical protein
MSLISDALKKARQEAARQDSLRQGLPYAVGAADPPVRRDPWISLLAGLGAGCILAVAMFALAYFAGWGPFHKPVAETRVAAAPLPAPASTIPTPPAAAAPAILPVAPPTAPPPTPVVAKPPPVVRTAPPPAAPVAEPIVSVRPARPEPKAAPPASLPVTPELVTPEPRPAPTPPTPSNPAPAGDSGSLVDGRVYVGEVPIPGGGSVKLNGIAFSQDQPVAVLDGRLMGPGEIVGGFTLVAIESGRVKLQGHGATVYLSPK